MFKVWIALYFTEITVNKTFQQRATYPLKITVQPGARIKKKGKKRFLSLVLIVCFLRNQPTSTRANDGAWHNICLVWSSTGGLVTFQKDETRLTGYGFSEGKIIPGMCKLIDFTIDLCIFFAELVVCDPGITLKISWLSGWSWSCWKN